MTVDVTKIRDWQERIFRLRHKADTVGKEVGRHVELAALGRSDQPDKLLTAAHLVDDLGDDLMRLAAEIRSALFVLNVESVRPTASN